MKEWFVFICSLFVALVAIISACAVNNILLRVLLILSALVSLLLAIWNSIAVKKIKKEMSDLKKNQLSVEYNDETVVFNKGE